MATPKLSSVDPVPMQAISLASIDLLTASVKQAHGIVHACWQAALHGGTPDNELLADALWAASDLLFASRGAIDSIDEPAGKAGNGGRHG